jgi:hypothetical protein
MHAEHAVEELQGLYGPFTMHEKIVQKIWLHGDFDRGRARLVDGTVIEIVHPGKWNLLGGPDFVGAHVRVGGFDLRGDVEVHFRAGDWAAHGHAQNPAYSRVVLHVVLFPPDFPECGARRGDGTLLPTLALLPLLHRDLEEYAADDALETLTARDDWRRFAELAAQPPQQVESQLRRLATERWTRKVAYMRARIARLGFGEAAHHTALEILGYRRNRVPMLTAATRWPLAAWTDADTANDVYKALAPQWNRHGVRPANQPRARLAQYARLVASRPGWPDALLKLAKETPDLSRPEGPSAIRDARSLKRIAAGLDREVTTAAIGGSRFHTLVCDGFLPLIAAHTGADLAGLWFQWFPGDVPESLTRALSRLGVTGVPGRPHCHGFAQGLLGWLVETEARV